MAEKRIYAVTGLNSDKGKVVRLVRASHPAAALRHVVTGSYRVEVAAQETLVALVSAGFRVEELAAQDADDADA